MVVQINSGKQENGKSLCVNLYRKRSATQGASSATDALSWPDLAKVTLGFRAFPLKHVKRGLLDPSVVLNQAGTAWFPAHTETVCGR